VIFELDPPLINGALVPADTMEILNLDST